MKLQIKFKKELPYNLLILIYETSIPTLVWYNRYKGTIQCKLKYSRKYPNQHSISRTLMARISLTLYILQFQQKHFLRINDEPIRFWWWKVTTAWHLSHSCEQYIREKPLRNFDTSNLNVKHGYAISHHPQWYRNNFF